jgi:hypothetical protein
VRMYYMDRMTLIVPQPDAAVGLASVVAEKLAQFLAAVLSVFGAVFLAIIGLAFDNNVCPLA